MLSVLSGDFGDEDLLTCSVSESERRNDQIECDLQVKLSQALTIGVDDSPLHLKDSLVMMKNA